MADAFTDNCGLVLQDTGENIGTWGTELNNLEITYTDSILGGTLSVSLASSNVALTQAQRRNLAFALSGTLTADLTITFPLNFNSATVATGGFFIFDNATSGAFTVTVKTVASGSTGVVVPQGKRAILYSNGTNVTYANDGGYAAFKNYAGNPNGAVTGYSGSAASGRPADMLWDQTNHIMYVSGGSGSVGTSGTVWYNDNISSSGLIGTVPISQGGTGHVTALAARGSSGLNIDQATSTSFNADSTIAATTRTVMSSATAMTASHILTLPAANSVNAGQALNVRDASGVVGTYTLTLLAAGSDAVNGGTTFVITTQYAGAELVSDGSSKWSVESILPNAGAYTASGGITLTNTNFTLDTNNSLGIGSSVIAVVADAGAGTLANGSTIAGSSLLLATLTYNGGLDTGSWATGAALSGVWRNISGRTLTYTTGGMFIRTS